MCNDILFFVATCHFDGSLSLMLAHNAAMCCCYKASALSVQVCFIAVHGDDRVAKRVEIGFRPWVVGPRFFYIGMS